MKGYLDKWQLQEVTAMIWNLGEALEILDSGVDPMRARGHVRAALCRINGLLEDQEL